MNNSKICYIFQRLDVYRKFIQVFYFEYLEGQAVKDILAPINTPMQC